eukprot:6777919-Prymnesium_polylepis.1
MPPDCGIPPGASIVAGCAAGEGSANGAVLCGPAAVCARLSASLAASRYASGTSDMVHTLPGPPPPTAAAP